MWKSQTVSEKVYLLIIICNGLPRLGIRNRQTDNPNTLGYLHSRQDDIQISFGVHFQIKIAYSLNIIPLWVSHQTYLPPRGDINLVHIPSVVGDVMCCSVMENPNQTTSGPYYTPDSLTM